jgi:hypothetical protein
MAPANSSLRKTLLEVMGSGATSNPALNRLLDDYAKEHRVTAIVSSLFLLVCVVLSVFCWGRWRRAPQAARRSWTWEKKATLAFGLFTTLIGAVLAVVIVANVSNAQQPREGLAGSFPMISAPQAGSTTDELHQAFGTWLRSGRTEMPQPVRVAIDERLAWQRPKAIICGVLFVLSFAFTVRSWATRIRRSRLAVAPRGGIAVGLVSVGVTVLLMLMVIGNTAGSFAPVNLTLLFG